MSRYIVGLTGGIGCGKSSVANGFRRYDIAVVDADAVAHELTGPGGAAMPEIERAFGKAVITPEGALDRAAMRKLAFEAPEVRVRLEQILHPRIRRLCDERCAEATSPYALLVVPLLVESGTYRERCQRVAVVDCPEEVQIARVMERNGMTRGEVERIMAAQATRQQRLAAADDVIDNSGQPDALAPQIAALHAKYLELARIG
jgi:dephospho-CoA kinase